MKKVKSQNLENILKEKTHFEFVPELAKIIEMINFIRCFSLTKSTKKQVNNPKLPQVTVIVVKINQSIYDLISCYLAIIPNKI